MKLAKIFVFLVLYAMVANAQDVATTARLNDYFAQPQELQGIIGYDANAQIEGQGVPNERAESLGSSKRQQVYEEGNGYQCTKEHCEVGHTFSTKATLDRETEIEKTGFIKDENGIIRNNKGYLDKAMQTIREAKNKFDFLSGGYTDCKPTKEVITSNSEHACDQYYDVKHNVCFPKQVVEIDPKYTYQCSKKREVKEKVCSDVIKSLTCKKNGECDSGGIILKSVASDMKWVYNYPTLILGTVAGNYWRAHCASFIRTTKFEVKNKNLINEFKIVEVGYDDYLRITINGTQVFNGPYGGQKLEIHNGRVHTGSSGINICELHTDRHHHLSIDLIPYLQEGLNELVMHVVVAGAGEGWAKIKTKQHCCTEWQEEREEKCDYL